MKRRIRVLASAAAALALTAVMLGWLAGLTQRKDSDFQYGPFFQQKEPFDVLFFGSSHILYGAYPMELWEDYGIVSYNLGGHGVHIPTTYWVMENALRVHKPRLVVVDCYLLEKQTKMFNNFSQVHQSLDVFPLSLTKVQAAFDLLDDSAFDEEFPGRGDRTRTKLGLLCSFFQYHNRWTELDTDDFSPRYTVEKGAESFNVTVAQPRTPHPTDEVLEQTTGMEYLRRIIRDCQAEGIEVLLVYVPFPAGTTEWREANTAAMIAEEYGVDYINYLQLDVADFATDCLDSWSHLNPSGARKVTEHLGRYITEHYDIPDRRGDADYAGWYADYEAYTDFKLELLGQQTDLKSYLMLLQDKHVSSCVYLAESALWSDPGQYRSLLENIGVDSGMLRTGGPTLAVIDRTNGRVTCLGPGETAYTGFGAVSLVQTEGAWAVRINGEDALTLEGAAVAGGVAIDPKDGTAAPARFSVTAASVTKIEP